ncbi:hypothetical protein [Neomegalonema perideroedes]|uniref:hypothetical protein n=1 Tax=Neomegalonema perideroedes TaxID=217219 RepID=UPI00037E2DD1|nr:hypothetical protein [Neomegalonema perideroedes]
MMRPEALATLRRWAEPLAVALALAWVMRESLNGAARGQLLGWAGFLVAALLAGWLYVAAQRARLHKRGAAASRPGTALGEVGEGRIFVEEGRIRRVGPFGRIEVSAAALTRVEVAPGATPEAALWLLSAGSGPPFAASRAEDPEDAIPDALSALPGFSLEAARAALQAKDGVIREVWRR